MRGKLIILKDSDRKKAYTVSTCDRMIFPRSELSPDRLYSVTSRQNDGQFGSTFGMDENNPRGVVQWVMPIRNSQQVNEGSAHRNRNQPTQSPTHSYDSGEYTSSFHNQATTSDSSETRILSDDNAAHRRNGVGTSSNSKPHRNSPYLIDMTTCRTICVIIEQYIKELRGHQDLINSARVKSAAELPYHIRDENFIAHTDLSRLKVRSEQIRATETIKQLTSYLRELSTIKNHLDSDIGLIDEDTYNGLSDIRNSIIQALNDFVLANDDIDYPIVDPDDPNGCDYDLCIDAHRSRGNLKYINTAQTSTCNKARTGDLLSDKTNVQEGNVLVMKPGDDTNQLDLIEKRDQVVQKLEKDTVELRRLFSDFYDLVKTQGEQIDTIEDNIVAAAYRISEGQSHLTHRPARGLSFLIPVTGCITGALIGGPIGLIIGGKLAGLTIIGASSLLGILSSLGIQRCVVGGNSNRLKYD